MTRISKSLIIATTLIIAGCSFVERNTLGLFRADSAQPGFSSPELASASGPSPASSEQATTVSIRPDAPAQNTAPVPGTRVEVIWAIPQEPVDGYIVRYGYNREDLKFEEKIASAKLDRYEDPQYGFVYRHVLKDVPPNSTVFVTLSAYTGKKISPPSPAFEVGPGAQGK
jgi:hypothetical protein